MRNKKLIKSIIAFIFVFGLILSNLSSVFVKASGSTDVVIHKMKLNNLSDWPKTRNNDGTYPGNGSNSKYDGTRIQDISSYFGSGAEELDGVKFTYWEVSKDQYEVMDKAKDTYKTKEKVKELIGENEGTTSNPTSGKNGVKVTLTNGTDDQPKYYWFIEELGSNIGNGETLSDYKAVPFGLALPMYKLGGDLFGTGDNALHVYPKNTVTKPEIDKNFTNVGANYSNYDQDKDTISKTIGSDIPYQVKTKLPAKAKYKTLRWEDIMDKGFTYNKDSLVVKITKVTGSANETSDFTKNTDYNVTDNESGFVLKFTEAGLEKIVGKLASSDYEIELNYSATLNSDAVVDSPEENRIKFDYSNNPKTFVDPRDKSTTPSNQQISVTKTWASGQPNGNVEVTYFLYEKGADASKDKVVATHKVNGNNYNHTFTGLEAGKKYYVKELVKGYDASYDNGNGTAGTIAITNTPDNDNPEPLIPTNPKVVTHGKKFVKTDFHEVQGATPLFGAQFIVLNNEKNKYLALKDAAKVQADKQAYTEAQRQYEESIATYNDLPAENQTAQKKAEVDAKKAVRDAAFNKIRVDYEWTTSENRAVKFTSNARGQLEVTGLEAGTYYLKETKAPLGYALLKGEISFTVLQGSYTNNGDINYEVAEGDQARTTAGTSAMQIKNKKITIPETGGIGTVIFTVVGVLVMGSAVVAMRRRKTEEE